MADGVALEDKGVRGARLSGVMKSLINPSHQCFSSTGKQCVQAPTRCFHQRLQPHTGQSLHPALCRSAAGDDAVSLADLRVRMDEAVKTEDYSTAAKLRDTMQ